MYAIIEDGSKQYRLCQGDVVDVEKRQIAAGQNTIELDQVLLIKDDKGTHVGTPILAGAKVIAKVNGPAKGKKLKMLKLRRRKNSRTHKGHRQEYLRVSIAEIHSGA
ncbi:MAG: 50S ribosomal protein L21 [Phycisphaerae bacterium]|nr:50S ribosomal protein L21 [Phycisphaerae bacterium]